MRKNLSGYGALYQKESPPLAVFDALGNLDYRVVSKKTALRINGEPMTFAHGLKFSKQMPNSSRHLKGEAK